MKKMKLSLVIILVLSTLLTAACGTAATATAATTTATTKAATTAATSAATTTATTAATTTVATTTVATTAADAIKISTQADLKGKIIAVQLGTIGDDIASKKETAAKEVQRFTQYPDAVSSLKQKKVDCIIMDADTAAAYVKQNPDIVVLDVGYDAEEYAMAVQKTGSDALLASINEIIATLKADGSIVKFKEAHANQTGKAPDFNKGAAGGKLIVGTNPTFPPYEYSLTDKTIIGVDIDIMAAVAKKMNKELVIENINFDGLIAALKGGKIQVIAAGMTVNEERKVNVAFSSPYTDAKQVVVIRKTSMK